MSATGSDNGAVKDQANDDVRIRLQRLEDQFNSNATPTKRNTTGDVAFYEPGLDYVHLKRKVYANPAPLGLFAFGLVTALLQGATTKWTEAGVVNVTYCYALFYGGLGQFLAGMWEFPRGNMFGAVAFSSYGCFWLGYGIFGILSAAGVLEGAAPEGLQMMLSLWGIFTFLLLLQTFAMNRALSGLFLSLTVTFFLLAAGVKNANCNKAGGYFGVFTALIAFYIAFAELTNEVYKKQIIPLGVITNLPTQRKPIIRQPTNIV